MTNYKLSGDNKGETLVVIYDEEDPVTVPGTHPKFDEILALLRSGEATDPEVEELVNEASFNARKIAAVTERVSVTPYAAFFDGDPLPQSLASVMVDLYNEGEEEGLQAFANFLDKASQNISMASVEALYNWVSNGDLVIQPDGNFLAYKGVQTLHNGTIASISSGTAWVDGVQHTGHIPNPVGAVITMPRSEVDSDGNSHCSTGLHAGTYYYASGFARGTLLLVEINPRDVVSVPNDCSFQKLRVSRYVVKEHITDRLENRLYISSDAVEMDDEGDFVEDMDAESYVYDVPRAFVETDNTLITGAISANTVGAVPVTAEDVVEELVRVIDDFGKRDKSGKFVKGGTVKMKRDKNGKFVGKKKDKKGKKK